MRRSKRLRCRATSSYQKLENRSLLAGAVFVDLSGGNLKVIGNDQDNEFSIDLRATTTEELVQGQNGTAVRFSESFDTGFSIEGIRDVRVYSNAGDDVVTIYGDQSSVNDDLIVSLGFGDDSLYVVGGETGEDVRVYGGAGHDSILIDGTIVGDDVSIYANAGKDVVALDGIEVNDQTRLLGQFGHDTILVNESTFGQQVYVEMGRGSDRFEAASSAFRDRFSIRGRQGFDYFTSTPSTNFSVAPNLQTMELERTTLNLRRAVDASIDQLKAGFFSAGNQLPTSIGNVLQDSLSELATVFGTQLVSLELNADSQTVSVEDPTPSVSVLWDRAVQQAVAATGPGPTVASRAYAMMHTAMYDAWSAYDALAVSTQLEDSLQRPTDENIDKNKIEAMSYAAYRVLDDLFSTQTEIFDGVMNELRFDVDNISTDATTAAGLGNRMAAAVLEFRHDDGANQLGDAATGTAGVPYSDTTGYTPGNAAGNPSSIEAWTPEFVPIDAEPGTEDRIQQFLTPHWGTVTPFALEAAGEYRPFEPEPFLLVDGDVNLDAKTITLGDGTVLPIDRGLVGTVINPGFISQAEEVVNLSAELSDEQKLVAEFWEDGGGTSFPPGTFMTFGQFVSARDNHSIDDDAKMFFAMGNAVFDAGVATWEAKVHYDYVRPVRAIRELGELGLIGEFDSEAGGYVVEAWSPGSGTQTILATDFLTYQTPGSDVSPPFSEYTSGHSAFSAAGATILKLFTESDEFNASVTFGAGESRFEPGITPGVETTLSWETFSAAADEAGLSRLYGGIHFDDGDINGRTLGNSVGLAVWERAQIFINGGIGN